MPFFPGRIFYGRFLQHSEGPTAHAHIGLDPTEETCPGYDNRVLLDPTSRQSDCQTASYETQALLLGTNRTSRTAAKGYRTTGLPHLPRSLEALRGWRIYNIMHTYIHIQVPDINVCVLELCASSKGCILEVNNSQRSIVDLQHTISTFGRTAMPYREWKLG